MTKSLPSRRHGKGFSAVGMAEPLPGVAPPVSLQDHSFPSVVPSINSSMGMVVGSLR